jgi:hypothetical protein
MSMRLIKSSGRIWKASEKAIRQNPRQMHMAWYTQCKYGVLDLPVKFKKHLRNLFSLALATGHNVEDNPESMMADGNGGMVRESSLIDVNGDIGS